METLTPKIEMRPPGTLRPYAGNARQHSRKQVRQIAESIRRFGFTNPVLIGDGDEIVAGHGRVRAAIELGLDRVPTIRLSHLTPAERRAYVLADNKLALNAEWDSEILAIELQALIDLDFDVSLRATACRRPTPCVAAGAIATMSPRRWCVGVRPRRASVFPPATSRSW